MSIEIRRNLANDFRSGRAERKGEYRNLVKSSEMILGVGVLGGWLNIEMWQNLVKQFRGWGYGEEGGVSKSSEI